MRTLAAMSWDSWFETGAVAGEADLSTARLHAPVEMTVFGGRTIDRGGRFGRAGKFQANAFD